MTIFHKLLANTLEAMGRKKDAQDVRDARASYTAPPKKEEPPPKESLKMPPPPEIPRAVISSGSLSSFKFGDGSTPSSGGALGGGSASNSSSNSSSNLPSNSPSSSPPKAPSSSSPEMAGGGGGGSAEKEGKSGDRQEKIDHDPQQHQPHEPQDFKIDPLAGVFSERMQNKIVAEAMSRISVTAADTAIVEEARRLLPDALKPFAALAVHTEKLLGDQSQEAREARIAALNGEIPDFYKGTKFDPAVIREKEAALAPKVPSNSPPKMEPKTPSNSPSISPPKAPPKAPSSDRGFDR